MMPSLLVYLGFALMLLGLLSLLKPLAFLGIGTRWGATVIAALGVLMVWGGMALPVKEVRITLPQTQLDEFAPVYQFHELHSTRILATREHVYQAIKSINADEILFFRTLVWMRRLGRPGPESILNPSKQTPLLEVATRTSFIQLAEIPGNEIVLGTAVAAPRNFRPKRRPTPEDFKAVRSPGFALASMNFLLQDAGAGACLLTTETRVFATDRTTQKRFAMYWRVIYPGSALIRIMWLRAIRRRAEAAGRSPIQ